ncbi:tRNA (guanosine(37)-N1)-methyltransferase TrmD [candidate division WWE3 bacterium]|uniref:tRNA (guanine-N(1)-)-methyltransferase n=1 Tax=candidate division WWE3 bacterium TaxID=2053526 RepID=A0A7X9E6X9_UNCKA|nr:tRNA (guanosine(37)-N1)-methyltransferase TrmD [candidate division WWE3 bacterium]
MIKFNVITLFPQIFEESLKNLPFKKAFEEKIAEYKLINLRDFSVNKYGSVDDKTYGGGVGMVLMIEPIFKALTTIYKEDVMKKYIQDPTKKNLPKGHRIVVLSPRGSIYNQEKVRELSKCTQVTLICGRYEGIDARVEDYISTDVISIGNYILSGGEIPALAIMESVTRILPGVLEKEEASKIESFSLGNNNQVEYPQYTKPENFEGLQVPNVLLSGNHKEIKKWRKEQSKKK